MQNTKNHEGDDLIELLTLHKEGIMAKIVKSVYGGGIVYEISRYSEEKKGLTKNAKNWKLTEAKKSHTQKRSCIICQ